MWGFGFRVSGFRHFGGFCSFGLQAFWGFRVLHANSVLLHVPTSDKGSDLSQLAMHMSTRGPKNLN